MEIKLWVVLSVVGLLLPIVGWGARWGINRIVCKLDEIIKKLADFQSEFAKVWGELSNMKDKQETHEKRINNHADRIKEIELKQAKNST